MTEAHGLEEFFGDYDWPSRPHWLEPDSPAKALGLDLHAATRELARLYPPDVCAELGKTRDGQRLIYPLYLAGLPWHTAPLLFLGADLARCDGWHAELKLMTALRRRSSWESARLEVGLWAGMCRTGLSVRYEPGAKNQARPDLVIEEDGVLVALETKSIGIPSRDRNVAQLERTVLDTVWRADSFETVPHVFVLSPGASLQQELDSLPADEFERDVIPLVRSRLVRWLVGNASQLQVGMAADLEGLGRVRVEPPDTPNTWSCRIEAVEYRGMPQIVSMALREVRRAAKQVGGAEAGVRAVVAWISAYHAPVNVALAELEVQIRRHPEPFKALDAVLLLNSHRLGGPWRTDAGGIQLPWAGRQVEGMRWLNGLVAWRYSV